MKKVSRPKKESRQTIEGMVYAMTNEAVNNQIVAFRRDKEGKLTHVRAYPTGGGGTGTTEVSSATPQDGVDPLASQGSLILSKDAGLLFAVNAGTGSISSFRVGTNGSLTLADVEPSRGLQPNSLAVFGNRLYVTNVGGKADNYASNISGFRVEQDGRLTPIAGARYSLSTPDAQPACVVVNPDGRLLVVSELTANRLSSFRIRSDGTLTGPIVNESAGDGPFGSAFLSDGTLLVSEAVSNSLSSYNTAVDGALSVIIGSVPNGHTATCWVVTSQDEHFAYTTNAGSGSISIYAVNDDGDIEFLENVASTLEGTSAAPIDCGVSMDGNNFYVLNGNKGWLSVFRIGAEGRLTRLQVLKDTGLPALGSQGIAIR